MSSMHAALRRQRRRYRHEHESVREITTSAADHGPLRLASVGPNSATSGVPTAPPMCSGPVSPEISTRARRAMAKRSVIDVAGASSAAPFEARVTSSANDCSPGPHKTSERSPQRSRIPAASAPKRSRGHRLFGHAAPGLIAAYDALSKRALTESDTAL